MKFRTKLKILAISLLAVLITTTPIKNAGILPYAEHNGKIYLLLGQDRDRPGRWTDFGGQIEQGETPAQAARREFAEETAGQVVDWQITSQTPYISNPSHKYRMYLVKIDYFDVKFLHENPEKNVFAWVPLERLLDGEVSPLYSPFAQTLRIGRKVLKSLKNNRF